MHRSLGKLSGRNVVVRSKSPPAGLAGESNERGVCLRETRAVLWECGCDCPSFAAREGPIKYRVLGLAGVWTPSP